MPKWKVQGYRSAVETGFAREVVGSDRKVRLLLERLAARHLTDDEITDVTFGTRTDLEVHWDHTGKTLSTTATDFHYVAHLEAQNAQRPKGEKRRADVIDNAVDLMRIASGEETDTVADDGKD